MHTCPDADARYQPIVDLVRREVVGVDVRAAEHDGLAVLFVACRQAARWAEQGLPLEVSVHLTTDEVTEPGLADTVREHLAQSRLDPSALLLWITERSLTDHELVGPALHALAATGVRLGLDEFGSGHSSLLHLRTYPISALKIDATFVVGIGRNRDDEATVASIASLASRLGARCTADGVETAEQLSWLLALRCHAQGPLFAAPVPSTELAAAVDRAEIVLEGQPTASSRQRPMRAPLLLTADVAEHIARMRRDGASLETIAASLNHAAAAHPLGLRWHARFVGRYVPGTSAPRRTAVAR